MIKLKFKLFIVNFSFLAIFLFTPPLALSFYNFFQNIEKSKLSKNPLLNHLDKRDVDEILQSSVFDVITTVIK